MDQNQPSRKLAIRNQMNILFLLSMRLMTNISLRKATDFQLEKLETYSNLGYDSIPSMSITLKL